MSDFEKTIESAEPKMTIDNKLDFITKYSEDILTEVAKVRAMLEKAKEEGLTVDIDSESEVFQVEGQHGIDLMNIRDSLMQLNVSLYNQGVLMTREELDKRLSK